MGGILILFVVLFVSVNLVQGTLLLGLMPFVIGFVGYFCIVGMVTSDRRRTTKEVTDKLERDIDLLEKCKKFHYDEQVCFDVGTEDDAIRKEIRIAEMSKGALNEYRKTGYVDKMIVDLLGTPSKSGASAAIADLDYRVRMLQRWLSDGAARELMRNTGRLYSPDGISKELDKREDRVYQLRSDLCRRSAVDQLAGCTLAVATILSPGIGIVCMAAYVLVYKMRSK